MQFITWCPGSAKVKIRSNSAVLDSRKKLCACDGQIGIANPDQKTVYIIE